MRGKKENTNVGICSLKSDQSSVSHSSWWITLTMYLRFCLLPITVSRFIPPVPSCLFASVFHSRLTPPLLSSPLRPPPSSSFLSLAHTCSPLSLPSLSDLCRSLIRDRDAGLLSGVKWPADSAVPSALRLWPWAACDLCDMFTMNLEGLEMIAVLVVVVLFVKVLEQFGLLEAGYDGKQTSNSFRV